MKLSTLLAVLAIFGGTHAFAQSERMTPEQYKLNQEQQTEIERQCVEGAPNVLKIGEKKQLCKGAKTEISSIDCFQAMDGEASISAMIVLCAQAPAKNSSAPVSCFLNVPLEMDNLKIGDKYAARVCARAESVQPATCFKDAIRNGSVIDAAVRLCRTR